jgi:radical SAM enzyme (TIGR01210 family)
MTIRTPELDPTRPWQFFAEEERSNEGEIVPVNTLFLTNRECPWRCVMCDLWKNTLTGTVPVGAIPAQIEYALSRLPAAPIIKLYNSGSFFDPRAIPVADYPAIARQLTHYDRVIVESHPALIGENCLRFRELIAGRLEVAMGLETVHPQILPRLNKGMTLEQFSSAANALRRSAIDLRAFILVKPPFLGEQEAVYWAGRSLDFAFSCGAAVAALIPTRGGNGALDELAARGEFGPPRIETLEASQEYGLRLHGGRVFADLWDLEKFAVCGNCYAARHNRLREMNLRQIIPGPVDCDACGVRA